MLRLNRLLILLLTFFQAFAWGQNQALISEIKGKLSKAKESDVFVLLNDLGWEYRFAQPDSTIFYCTQAYELGKALNLKVGLARPLNYNGVAYSYKGEPINSFDQHTQAFRVAEAQADSTQIAYANNNMGRLLSEQGLHSKALEYFLRARKIFKNTNDSSGMAYAYQSIGRIYDAQRDFKEAEENFRWAYQLRLKLGNTRDIMAALVLLGRTMIEAGNRDEALDVFYKADSAGTVIHDAINLAEIKLHMAKIYLAKRQLDSAQRLSTAGYSVIVGQNNIRMMPESFLIHGQVKTALGRYGEARKLYSDALEIAKRTKELTVKMEAHFLLWKLAEIENNKNDILQHQNQYLVIQDSVKDLELTRSLERLQFEVEIQKRELQNQLAKAQDRATIESARWQNIFLSLVTFFTLLLAFIFWRNNKKKQQINLQLVEQNHKLEELNHEKDTLMNIVAHDLKSPLNRINGLIHLTEIDHSPGALSKYIDIIKKTTQSGLTLIGDLLDLNAASEELLKPAIQEVSLQTVIDSQIEKYQEAASTKNIIVSKLNTSDILVDTDSEFISRILDNLLSNAIKFSHPNSAVLINSGVSEREFFVSVKDAGPGFSEKDRDQLYQKFRRLSARPTASESSNGLGLALIKNLVERLGGKIELISLPRQGSEFIVTIPCKPVATLQPS